MSKELRNIGDLLRSLGGPAQSYVGRVLSVTDDSCNVDDNGFTFYNVRLRAAIDGKNNRVVLVPKVGSWVMISRIDQSEQFFVSQVSEVERVMMVIQDKYVIKNVATSLKTILNDLVTELKAAIINTPSGPGSISPSTMTKLDLVNAKVNKLFQE
ncbi:MAG TPA: hypothetical protein ENN08_06695 [Bacteroidales bacterium]|nr:hypothetical protein [Bacteroidales bacterium]